MSICCFPTLWVFLVYVWAYIFNNVYCTFLCTFLCGEEVREKKLCGIMSVPKQFLKRVRTIRSTSLLPIIHWDQLFSTIHMCFLGTKQKRLERHRPVDFKYVCWQQRSIKVQDPTFLHVSSCLFHASVTVFFFPLFFVLILFPNCITILFFQQLLEFPFLTDQMKTPFLEIPKSPTCYLSSYSPSLLPSKP